MRYLIILCLVATTAKASSDYQLPDYTEIAKRYTRACDLFYHQFGDGEFSDDQIFEDFDEEKRSEFHLNLTAFFWVLDDDASPALSTFLTEQELETEEDLKPFMERKSDLPSIAASAA